MSFDPSIISQIPTLAGNPMAAKQQAYTLKDLIDQEQLGRLKLHQAKQADADTQAVRGILSKQDISTPDGMFKAAAALTKGGFPQQAMDMLSAGRTASRENLQAQADKLKLLQLSSDVVGPAAVQILGVLQTQGLAAAQQAYKSHIAEFKSQLPQSAQAGLPPQLPPTHAAALQFLQGAINRSGQARQILQQQQTNALAQRRQNTEEESLSERERHDRVQETSGGRYGVKEPTSDAGKNLKDQFIEMVGGKVTLAQLRGMDFDELAKRGDTAASLEKRSLAIGGAQAEEGALGRREAGIESSAEEARNVIPIAIAASDAVPRGQFVPLTKLIQAGKIATSDPKLAAFAQANLTLANVYARAMSPTGTPTVEGREEALKKLSVATSPESYKAVVGIIQQEIDAARRAPGTISGDVLDRATGGAGTAPSPGAAKAAVGGSSGAVVDWNSLP